MTKDQDTSKLWGGRFSEATDTFVQRFTASVQFDQRMAAEDIAGSLAHASMLCNVGVLDENELQEIQRGLAQVQSEIENGSFQWSVELEDVHMNIEARLTELIGVTGKKLHTGRSRNDQVATDIRLYLRGAIDRIAAELTRLQRGTIEMAAQNTVPTCRPPNRFPSGTTCWPGTRCWSGTTAG
jgi:argininosuccinate lyase